MTSQEIQPGTRIVGQRGTRIGTVDAVFADYVLVRTPGLLPYDLYVPRPSLADGAGALRVDCTAAEARRRWHRPLRRAPHE